MKTETAVGIGAGILFIAGLGFATRPGSISVLPGQSVHVLLLAAPGDPFTDDRVNALASVSDNQMSVTGHSLSPDRTQLLLTITYKVGTRVTAGGTMFDGSKIQTVELVK